jgi:hypothetical protein
MSSNNNINLEKELITKLDEFVTLYENQDELSNIDKYLDVFNLYLPKRLVKRESIFGLLMVFYLNYSNDARAKDIDKQKSE